MTEEKIPVPKTAAFMLSPESRKLQATLERGRTVIGLHVGHTSVNVAQTAMHQGKPTLIRTAVEDIAAENESERESATLTALKKALAAFNFRRADIICIMPGRQVVVETMIMPLMPPQELLAAVKLQIAFSQQSNMDKSVMDVNLVERVQESGIEKTNVLAAAASRTAIDHFLETFILREKWAKQVGSIIPTSMAMENVMKRSGLYMDKTIALVEIGAAVTELNIYRSAKLELSRKIAIAGADLTSSLSRSLFTNAGKIELTMEEAESVKLQYGIPAPGENYLILDKIVAGQVLSLLRPKLEQLAAEIGRSMNLYHEKTRTNAVDRIVLFGGGALLKGLTDFLNAELGLPVEIGQPRYALPLLADGVMPSVENDQRLVLAIGASLGGVDGINLLPLHLKERKKRFWEKVAVIAASGIFLLACSGVYLGSMLIKNSVQQKLSLARNDYRILLPRIYQLKQGFRLKKLVRERPDLGSLLKQLSFLPANVYLTQLNITAGRVTLFGFVAAGDQESQDASLALVEELRKGILRDIRLVPAAVPSQVPALLTALRPFEIHARLGGADIQPKENLALPVTPPDQAKKPPSAGRSSNPRGKGAVRPGGKAK